jgi:acyl-CoA synthetase (AMP-forming)/AMP-acid ligase II
MTATSGDQLAVGRLADRVGSGSLASLLAWRACERPDHPFLYIEEERPWTFGELAHAARDTAARLAKAGVTTGGRVLTRIGNDERFAAVLVAAWMRGATLLPMHPAAPVGDVARTAEVMKADVLVCDPEDDAANAAGQLPVITVGALEHRPADGAGEPLEVPENIPGTDPALILLTSGSTGEPKGVMLTHDNAWASLRATVSAFRSDTGPSPLPDGAKPPNLIANPLSHTAGIVRMLFNLYVGRDVVLLRKFNGAMAKRLIDAHGINNLTLNPTMLRMLLDQVPAGEKLGKVRYVSSGTAPLTPALREQFEERFGIPVLQAYGQTEAFGGIAIEAVKDVLAGHRRPGSVGKALPGVRIRITSPGGEEVPAGEQGEIWVRSRSAMAGYVTAADQPTPGDEWLRTGDLGRLDDDGYLYITGRLKNIIICGGFNILPEEVEAAIEQDERVTEAVVVPWPDDRLGEIPVAVVEGTGTPDDLLAAAAQRLASYKRPRHLLRVDALPRVPNGKVNRAAVTRIVRGQPAADQDSRKAPQA